MYDSFVFSISAGIIVLFYWDGCENDTSKIHVAERCTERTQGISVY